MSFASEVDESASLLVESARRTLFTSGGRTILANHLRKKIDTLPLSYHPIPRGNSTQTKEELDLLDFIVTGWIEELLKFLALKTIMGDTTMPFHLVSSAPIEEAWKALLIMPTCYRKLCHAMGNVGLIDHDPFDNDKDDKDLQHRKKRFNSTLRAYQEHYDNQPLHMYWPEPRAVTETPISTSKSPFSRLVGVVAEKASTSCGSCSCNSLPTGKEATVMSQAK